MHACAYVHVGWSLRYCHCSNLGFQRRIIRERSLVPMFPHTRTLAHAHIIICIRIHSLPVLAYSTAGVALFLLSPSAHAVILYWAPGTTGLIVTLLPLPAFTYYHWYSKAGHLISSNQYICDDISASSLVYHCKISITVYQKTWDIEGIWRRKIIIALTSSAHYINMKYIKVFSGQLLLMHGIVVCCIWLAIYYTYSMCLCLQYIAYKCTGLVLYFVSSTWSTYEPLIHEAHAVFHFKCLLCWSGCEWCPKRARGASYTPKAQFCTWDEQIGEVGTDERWDTPTVSNHPLFASNQWLSHDDVHKLCTCDRCIYIQ